MPLTCKVAFNRALQKGNRVQIPKLIRWRFKMEPQQVLSVSVSVPGSRKLSGSFYARREKDGRLLIPKSALAQLREKKSSIVGCMLEVTLEPV